MVPRGGLPGLRPGERLGVTARPAFMAMMVVLRAPGEVYLQGCTSATPADNAAWLERIDPVTLAPLARSPDLPAGGVWWPGGVVAHANGFLYLTHGRFCHKLGPDCAPVCSRELPRAAPYNSLLVLSDGRLVMKDLVRDGSGPSSFVVLDPERLEPLGPEVTLPEGSIARISKDVVAGRDVVYAIGTHHAYRLTWDGSRLEIDRDWQPLYRTRPDAEQSYGWDAVIADGSAWFLDNGDNVFTRSFRGGGVASGPIHLVRIALDAPGEVSAFAPFGLPHGTVANPPLVDPSRRIVVAFDSGNARIGAFRYGPRVGDPYTPLWEHAFGAANHFLLDEANGQVVVDDFDGEQEHAVVLDVESGIELGRAATGSAVQSVVFQAAGFDRDAYCCSFLSVARIFADGRSDSQGGLER